MIIQIEPHSEIPIYTQLTNQIIEGIARGEMKPGDALPSVRSFAADLGVNMHTVNKSYHELERKGIIRIIPKSGAVINSPDVIVKEDHHFMRIKEEFKLVVAEALVLGMTKEQIRENIQSIILDLKGESE
ncbi:GntR family transcriptional regulator [Heyndrickxia oleronia]|uniref:GntR family transcriptional regulator n=1 Tax=Heyndrickxia oleronia TaxID=38875 RepID=A0AAW6SY66_9BACI|nr:GntR family transcriptional regulator [Heyndrickxia oleronia]MCM3236122.1 GntR family transcriptional regulator [Heyndrickxia oleronia]MDH5162375.1 GntR family transcriptional regulator [Heyndrickxia oleronia]